MTRYFASLLSSAVFLGLTAASVQAQTPAPAAPTVAPAAPASTLPRAEVEAIIKDYLVKNPEVIFEAVTAYKKKEEDKALVKAQQTITEKSADLFNDPMSPSIGDASKADITIVEFYDFHCGYCKHFLPTIAQLTKEDPKVRIVFKDLPILSADSAIAAKASLAAYKASPEKYFEYHTALMNIGKENLNKDGQFTEAGVTALAKKVGINEAKFKEALKDPALDQQIKKDQELAQALGVQGTPSLVVGKKFIPGATSLDDLKAAIKEQRESTAAKPADKSATAPTPATAPAPAAAPAAK